MLVFKLPYHNTYVGEVYSSESTGSDETGKGTEAEPFKTILKVRNILDNCLASNLLLV